MVGFDYKKCLANIKNRLKSKGSHQNSNVAQSERLADSRGGGVENCTGPNRT